MPDRDGYELIRKSRAGESSRTNRLAAIAVTAYARPEDRQRSLLAGYQMHLTKPIEAGELVAGMASLLHLRRDEPYRALSFPFTLLTSESAQPPDPTPTQAVAVVDGRVVAGCKQAAIRLRILIVPDVTLSSASRSTPEPKWPGLTVSGQVKSGSCIHDGISRIPWSTRQTSMWLLRST
jgi:DNA-binding response OmpR family regulator